MFNKENSCRDHVDLPWFDWFRWYDYENNRTLNYFRCKEKYWIISKFLIKTSFYVFDVFYSANYLIPCIFFLTSWY